MEPKNQPLEKEKTSEPSRIPFLGFLPAVNFYLGGKSLKVWDSDILHSSFHKPFSNEGLMKEQNSETGGLGPVESMVSSDTKSLGFQ